ncbi:unnamed protein product [Leptosia nina]|uniref:Spherulin-2A n=1 Tax=Leptosia nina TaxID=320188 RepID=A0AAV1JMB8_9NEOP
MLLNLLLLVCPTITSAIHVTVLAIDEEKIDVSFRGTSTDVISDKDREIFQLTDTNLKKGVHVLFDETPDDVFIKNPTPWGDLHDQYGWDEVKTVLKPIFGRLVSKKSERQTVAKQTYDNKSAILANFTANFTRPLQETINIIWVDSELSVHENISHEFELFKFGGKQQFLSAPWGVDTTKMETFRMSSEKVETVVEPGQSVTVEIKLTKTVLTIEVVYEATLTGKVAINYENKFRGHHFWSVGVNEVLSRIGLKNSIKSKEVIDIVFYSKEEQIFSDPDFENVAKNM